MKGTWGTLRRLTGRALARKYADRVDAATRPYQFALQTRAGVDALAGALRAAVDLDSAATIVSIDGRAAYDSISRHAVFTALCEHVPELVPFARAMYGHPSQYHWWDDLGQHHQIPQGEGVEQGDPLAPALYALGQHHALAQAATHLRDGELLAAYLDDIYIVCPPERAADLYTALTRSIAAHAGVAANQGKTRVYNRLGGPPPPGIAALGTDVWCGSQPPEANGLVALGTPIGTDFVAAYAHARLCGPSTLPPGNHQPSGTGGRLAPAALYCCPQIRPPPADASPVPVHPLRYPARRPY